MNDTTIRLSPHATFWVLTLLFVFMAFLLFADILLPFVAGAVLAYLFHPLVNRMCKIGIHRGVASFTIIAVASLIFAIIVALLLPPLLDQLGALVKNLPEYVERLRSYVETNYGRYLEPVREQLNQVPGQQNDAPNKNISQQVAQTVAPWLIAQSQRLISSSLALFNSLALLFITPVVTFFLLRDWDKMVESVARLLPRQDAPTIEMLATEIDSTISAYLGGTVIVLIIVSAFYMVALGLIGLNYGLLIGLVAGLISFVPYLGSTTGFLVAGGVAAAQYWPNYTQISIVLVVFVMGQLIEGNVLTPNIVGNKVRLHPVWLLFALIASGYVLGFTGLLVSVPLAAIIGVLVRHAMRQYYESEMYNRDAAPVFIPPSTEEVKIGERAA